MIILIKKLFNNILYTPQNIYIFWGVVFAGLYFYLFLWAFLNSIVGVIHFVYLFFFPTIMFPFINIIAMHIIIPIVLLKMFIFIFTFTFMVFLFLRFSVFLFLLDSFVCTFSFVLEVARLVVFAVLLVVVLLLLFYHFSMLCFKETDKEKRFLVNSAQEYKFYCYILKSTDVLKM